MINFYFFIFMSGCKEETGTAGEQPVSNKHPDDMQ